jgi:hypothetical protein
MPDNSNDTTISLKEAVSVLYLAQHEYSEKDFKNFCKELLDENIPWDFEDNRFLEKIKTLKETLAQRLTLQDEGQLRVAAEATTTKTVTPDELDSMEQGLELIQQKTNRSKKVVYDHTEQLVNTYVKKLKTQRNISSAEEEKALNKEINSVKNLVSQKTRETLVTGNVEELEKELSVALQETVSMPGEVKAAVLDSTQLTETTRIVFTSGDETHKGVFIEQCLNNPEIDPEIIVSKIAGAEAAKAFALPESTKLDIASTLQNEDKSRVVFAQAAKAASGMQQGVSGPLNDVVTAVSGPGGKQFLDDVVGTILGTSLKDIENSKERGGGLSIGGVAIQSTPETEAKIKEMQQSFIDRWGTKGSAHTRTRDYLRRHAAAPTQQQPAPQNASVQPGQPIQFGSSSSTTFDRAVLLFSPTVQNGIRVYLESSSIRVAQFSPEALQYLLLVGTDSWRQMLVSSTKQAVGKIANSFIKKKTAEAVGAGVTFGAVLGPGGSAALAAITAFVVNGAIGKGLSFLWKGATGLFSFFREIGKGVFQRPPGPPTKKEWYEQDDWIISLVIVGGFFVVCFLALIRIITTQAAFFKYYDEGSAIGIVPGENTGVGVSHGNPAPDSVWNGTTSKTAGAASEKSNLIDVCAAVPPPSYCLPTAPDSNNPWPVVSSNPNVTPYVTQGPGGSFSHKGANAVDIGLPLYSTMLSPVDGVVTQVVNQYADNKGYKGSSAGGGYGNYVVVHTSQGYDLLVGHLAYNSMPAVGSTVTTGSVLGRSGNTGSSTGSHFHIEYKQSSPSINTILPVPVPVGCSSAASCGYIKAKK